MISTFKLPFKFEPGALQTDLAQISDNDWVAHFNAGYFEGQWTQNDAGRRKEKATARIREAAAKWVSPIYEELEAARVEDPR